MSYSNLQGFDVNMWTSNPFLLQSSKCLFLIVFFTSLTQNPQKQIYPFKQTNKKTKSTFFFCSFSEIRTKTNTQKMYNFQLTRKSQNPIWCSNCKYLRPWLAVPTECGATPKLQPQKRKPSNYHFEGTMDIQSENGGSGLVWFGLVWSGGVRSYP